MVSRLILTSMVVLFWVQPCLAHDSPEEIAAMEAEKKPQDRVRKQQAIVMKQQVSQAYTKWVNGWVLEMKVLPLEKKANKSTVQIAIRKKDGKKVDISSVALILMSAGRKFSMQKSANYFQTSLTFPSRDQTTMMVKIKDKYERTYFVQFQY